MKHINVIITKKNKICYSLKTLKVLKIDDYEKKN